MRTDPPGQPNLGPRQREILKAIGDSLKHRGYPPTLREIGEATGLASASSVSYHLSILEQKGHLRRVSGRPRTAVIKPPDHPANAQEADGAGEIPVDIRLPGAVEVPLIGRIAAGGPILAEQAAEDIFCLPEQLLGKGESFMLKVAGDSMVDAGILDGDLVVVRRQPDANSGDIVAATIDGIEVEGTVKTLRRSDDHAWLVPHNPDYAPILGDAATILGKVVTVLRRICHPSGMSRT